ncbi:MAG: ABC transporter permease [Clostridia bacterium]|nr:ABC transporter permease [Clostridia bacterium]
MKKHLIAVPYYVWAVVFIAVPLLMIGYCAFTDASGAFTLENIQQITKYWPVMLRSLLYAAVATACCLVIGYLLAYCMAQQSERTKTVLMILLMLPMWISFVLRTQAMQDLLDLVQNWLKAAGIDLQVRNNALAVVLGLIYNYLPFMVLPIYTSLEKLDKRVIEAAEDLGANRFNVFRKVILPLTMPGVGSGIIMVFVPTISTFVVSEKLGGAKFNLIGNVIQEQFLQVYNPNVGAAISLVMLVLILFILIIFSFLDDETKEGLL